jgi:hypothetical protein
VEPEAPEPQPEVEIEQIATEELVAALAGGAALSFEPDVEEEEVLLPVVHPVVHARDAEAEETPRAH